MCVHTILAYMVLPDAVIADLQFRPVTQSPDTEALFKRHCLWSEDPGKLPARSRNAENGTGRREVGQRCYIYIYIYVALPKQSFHSPGV